MRTVAIDRARRLAGEPGTGHNRWHPDIPPIVEVGEGEDVLLETRDAVDGDLGPSSTESDLARVRPGTIHPWTGPVYVTRARPGHPRESELADPRPRDRGFSASIPNRAHLVAPGTTPSREH